MVKSMPGTSRLVKVCKTFKEKSELPGYQQQSDTRLFSKLQTLDKKVKRLKRKKK